MKKNHLFMLKMAGNLILISIVLLLVSCTHGYKDDWNYISDVKNATLESPDAKDVKFTPSSDGGTVTTSWPVVHGAKGYEFSLFIVDDPDNPILVGEEKEFIDGCSVQRELQEDTKYKVVVKALGNEALNNKDATSNTEAEFNTLLDVYQTIPSGTDLGTYFASNPIPKLSDLGENVKEIAYQLEPGGEYTMTSDVALGLTTLTIRGDKVDHAKIKMSTGVFLTDGMGFKLKFIDFDCENFNGNALITYNPTRNSEVILANDWVEVTLPVAIQSCNIKKLSKLLINDKNERYAIQTVLIKDCVIEQDVNDQRLIHIQKGIIKDLTLVNSTFYNKQVSTQFFIQYNSQRVNNNSLNWTPGSISVTNCTFWQVAKSKDIANYAGLARSDNYCTIRNCIFVDSGNKQVVRRFRSGGGSNMILTIGYNSYWYDGEFVSAEISSSYDNSGTHFTSDPKLKNPANGDFTVGGSDQLNARTGDPRWLPAE